MFVCFFFSTFFFCVVTASLAASRTVSKLFLPRPLPSHNDPFPHIKWQLGRGVASETCLGRWCGKITNHPYPPNWTLSRLPNGLWFKETTQAVLQPLSTNLHTSPTYSPLLLSLHLLPPLPPLLFPSTQAYALSRDHGLPFASLWRQVNSWGVPVYAILLSVLISVIFNIPLLAGNSAYYAVTGTATTAWFTAYAVPIGFRLTAPQSSFVPGPFCLAEFVGPIGR